MRRALLVGAATVAIALALTSAAQSAKKDKKGDLIWTRPDYASLGVDRIALLPVATYDHNFGTASLVEGAVGQALKSTGYRWLSANLTRDLLRARAGGDSILKALDAAILKEPRVDSLSAPRICALLNCDALLCVRVDQWEQFTPEWNQAGKPTTTVQLKAALVDSVGRLAWSAAGNLTGEGPYYDPNTAPTGVKDSGLDRKPISAQGGAPSYREVVTSLFNRWAPAFPPKPAAAGAAPADSAAITKPQ
jgi:hypothetical protein